MRREILLWGGGALTAAALAAGVVLYLRLGALITAAVEAYGPKITKTEVRLVGAGLSPWSGRGHLRGLFIGNPEGFRSESAFKLAQVKVAVDLKSLRTDTIVVKEILVEGPVITFEQGLDGSNISRIQKNVESFAPPASGKAQASSEKKVIISRFVVEDGKINLSLTQLGGRGVTIPLPRVELRDIGKRSGGASVKEAAKEIFSALTAAILKAVAASGELLKGAGRTTAAAAGKSFSKLKGLLKK